MSFFKKATNFGQQVKTNFANAAQQAKTNVGNIASDNLTGSIRTAFNTTGNKLKNTVSNVRNTAGSALEILGESTKFAGQTVDSGVNELFGRMNDKKSVFNASPVSGLSFVASMPVIVANSALKKIGNETAKFGKNIKANNDSNYLGNKAYELQELNKIRKEEEKKRDYDRWVKRNLQDQIQTQERYKIRTINNIDLQNQRRYRDFTLIRTLENDLKEIDTTLKELKNELKNYGGSKTRRNKRHNKKTTKRHHTKSKKTRKH